MTEDRIRAEHRYERIILKAFNILLHYPQPRRRRTNFTNPTQIH